MGEIVTLDTTATIFLQDRYFFRYDRKQHSFPLLLFQCINGGTVILTVVWLF